MEKISLRGARVNAGIQVDEVTEVLGITRQWLYKLETDSSNITYERLMKLSELYHIPYEELFIGLESDYHEQLEAGQGFHDSMVDVFQKEMERLHKEHTKTFKRGADPGELTKISDKSVEVLNQLSKLLYGEVK